MLHDTGLEKKIGNEQNKGFCTVRQHLQEINNQLNKKTHITEATHADHPPENILQGNIDFHLRNTQIKWTKICVLPSLKKPKFQYTKEVGNNHMELKVEWSLWTQLALSRHAKVVQRSCYMWCLTDHSDHHYMFGDWKSKFKNQLLIWTSSLAYRANLVIWVFFPKKKIEWFQLHLVARASSLFKSWIFFKGA